ncbi:pentapeptide repeat-containing protein [Streptomyces radiopugnans]|uniref:pentapeptide repeat-containing protein n=1 Tax=Streptomyces radiopugnans TaxID=403935 RepID=UPI003F19551D
MDEADRAAYLAALSPGAGIDHSGTPFTEDLLARLLVALRDPTTGKPRLGHARFDEAIFAGVARFAGVEFTGDVQFLRATFADVARFDRATFARVARFDGVSFTSVARFDRASFVRAARFDEAAFTSIAQFDGADFADIARFDRASFARGAQFRGASFARVTWFTGTSFTGDARFDGASFAGVARFDRAAFARVAWFRGASFTRDARFGKVVFADAARFDRATFTRVAWFTGASFARDACFSGARFETTAWLGPLVCSGTVVLDGAVFEIPVTVEAAAHAVSCDRTRWASTATLGLRYAELDLSNAVLEFPLTITARPAPFRSAFLDAPLPETSLFSSDTGVHLISMDGVDAAHLVLHDIDLSRCRFAGAIHLDQLRVDGWCTFATTPTGAWRHRLLPRWWSQRNTLVEEHHWRAQAHHPAAARGWTPPPEDTAVLRPAAVAALYRQVRKSLEDGKNEPDAADFYYGEMEMRRHDDTRPQAERALLTAYWALSGYGLRAARALAWLLGAMATTLLALLLWGLPADDPKPTTTGRQAAAGQEVTWTTDTPDPRNPTGPLTGRITTERFEKALRVVINSVAFRSSGQELTTTGTYTEMASRLAEPVLLGLAVLAVRARVKR